MSKLHLINDALALLGKPYVMISSDSDPRDTEVYFISDEAQICKLIIETIEQLASAYIYYIIVMGIYDENLDDTFDIVIHHKGELASHVHVHAYGDSDISVISVSGCDYKVLWNKLMESKEFVPMENPQERTWTFRLKEDNEE